MSASTLPGALIAVAAAENAAVYGYSVAGARLAGHDKAVAVAGYDAHRAQVQAVTGWLAASNATPAPPAPVYDLPTPVSDATSARATLAAIEESTAAAYADLVAVCDGDLQRNAALALQSAAVRESQWRTTSVPFPGLVGRISAR